MQAQPARHPLALPKWARGAAQAALKIAYPLVLIGAWHFGTPRYAGIALLALLWMQRWIGAGSVSTLLRQLTPLDWLTAGTLTCMSAAVAITDSELLLRLYPALVNAGLLLSFAATLRSGPSMIEKFARMRLPDLQPRAVCYTRRVTQAWCVFFALNGVTAMIAALYWSRGAWALYNGVIAYVLVGVLVVAEMAFRHWIVRPHALPSEAT
ncbi:hypothetical protein [Ralstonia holmesii]|uniref:COG4648 family protein n=1 Tax=Ralstonia holmesii TaxID=3058602 RepID=UPI0028F5E8CE|nr:hypothetical protein [Ralstonia sp. LMG 32967]CAJ0699779.1 hypothetical protein R11007_03126 [Ralstonia sp. LMG 32967]